MSGIERKYSYRPSWFPILICVGFFGSIALFTGWKAEPNKNGQPLEAVVLYTALCAVSAAVVHIAALIAAVRLRHRQRIAFTATSIVVPKSRWSPEEQAILYSTISGLTDSEPGGQRFLQILHSGGRYTIVGSMLPDKEALEEIRSILIERMRDRSASGSPPARAS